MKKRNALGQTEREFLAAYDPGAYERPSVTVDMAVFTLLPDPMRLATLLIKRGDHPYIDRWAFPGGFVNMDEDIPCAAARELEEETGLADIPLMEIGCFGAPGRDPRTRVITIAHFALSPMGSLHPDAGDDAADAQLFSIESSLQQTDALGRLVTLHVRQAKAKGVLGKVQIRQKQRRIGRQVQWQTEREGKSFLASDHDLMLFQALRSLCALGERALPLLLPQSFSKGTLEQAQGVLQALRADVGGVWCD